LQGIITIHFGGGRPESLRIRLKGCVGRPIREILFVYSDRHFFHRGTALPFSRTDPPLAAITLWYFSLTAQEGSSFGDNQRESRGIWG